MSEQSLYEKIKDQLAMCSDRELADVLEVVIYIRKQRREAFKTAHDLGILDRAIAKNREDNGEA